MLRRLHVSQLFAGEVPLDRSQARHARVVLRLAEGATVELFDDHGAQAAGTLVFLGERRAAVRVAGVTRPPVAEGLRLTVASALPKGERADWMVEKLSELGVCAFVPLAAARSVVLPAGKAKHERWVRISTESAKQSRRPGVMRLAELTPVERLAQELSHSHTPALLLSTAADAIPIAQAVRSLTASREVVLLIGPEGGWTDHEIARLQGAGATAVRLTATVLRVETAAIAAAAVVLVHSG